MTQKMETKINLNEKIESLMPSTKNVIDGLLKKAGITLNGSKSYDIQVNDERLYKRLKYQASLGAGEGYMDGWWDCESLDEMFYLLCKVDHNPEIHSKSTVFLKELMNSFVNMQTRVRSLAVADQHYNLGNDLYEKMLGETMAYTCGYWKEAQTLDKAQFDKFDLICRKLELKAGEKILELGCGWGSFAKYAAEKYGCEVVAANISTEQVSYGREINKGLPVEIHLCDYRDAHVYNPKNIKFDKVVSVGLCEHVGIKNYRGFMELARNNMKEDGLFLLHTIGKLYSSSITDPWITKYIFPNSVLPSVKQLASAIEGVFVLEDLHNFGADYDKTLMAWHHNFNKNWDSLKGDYDEKFFRLWNYYLLSCAGAFRARSLELWQFVLSPNGVIGGYDSKR